MQPGSTESSVYVPAAPAFKASFPVLVSCCARVECKGLSSSWCPAQMLMVLHFEDASAMSGFGCLSLLCSISLLQVRVAPAGEQNCKANLLHLGARIQALVQSWVVSRFSLTSPTSQARPASCFLWYLLLPWLLSALPQATVVVWSCESNA